MQGGGASAMSKKGKVLNQSLDQGKSLWPQFRAKGSAQSKEVKMDSAKEIIAKKNKCRRVQSPPA